MNGCFVCVKYLDPFNIPDFQQSDYTDMFTFFDIQFVNSKLKVQNVYKVYENMVLSVKLKSNHLK